ncbi:isopentenyl phosphate kinase isoform X2 [Nymphaea colorata]|uniref:isopentenyl phosphate kinase isoform X2 n=1 Tax=Nymphaea colorata TaxID=210225 RepID=UPI00129D247C|nr:isopentenyl phosphate kinase isoform X2 [Nymphaea colorata]
MADEAPPSPVSLSRPLRCIVKLGGSAVTHKDVLEHINDKDLAAVASQLREVIMHSTARGYTMDWSKQSGIPPTIPADIADQVLSSSAFIVVHGAGSFGHFQASRAGVHRGGLHLPLVTAGFVATRISVTALNLEIVRALAKEGIPSVGISPFSCGWSTCEKKIQCADISPVTHAIDSGLIPVMHGDAVLDSSQGCTILSGDIIIRHLAQLLRPQYVVFLTDVMGVYDRPPTDPNAILLREIAVNEDGSWCVVNPRLQDIDCQVEITVAPHDTTGGMTTKISEAAMIAKLGIDVYIVKAGTTHSVKALRGELNDLPGDWLGTAIRPSNKST